MKKLPSVSAIFQATVAGVVLLAVAGWAWARWATWHLSADEIGIAVWLVAAATAFFVAYFGTKKIRPASRREVRAWFKAAARAFPWAFLLTPSVALGFISLPMPAGLLVVGWLWQKISQAPYVQGPQNATGPIACIALGLSWSLISAGTLFGLKLRDEKA